MFIFGGKDKFRRRRQDKKKDGDMQKDVTKKKKNDNSDEENDDLSMLERRMQFYINDDVQQCFDSFDVTGTGVINFEQVKMAFSSFYIDVDDDDCEEVISAFDTTESGNITYDDFYREMRDVMAEGTLEHHIKMVFDMMDRDGDGIIGVEEIKTQFKKFGIVLSDEEVHSNMSKIDVEDNGYIDYEMFRDYCNEKCFVQVIGNELSE